MAHRKAGGSTRLGRDSISKRLGVKLFSGQSAEPGNIIIRQRGKKYREGINVRRGEDDTLYATASGVISFTHKKVRKFNGSLSPAVFVNVIEKPAPEKKK